MIARKNLRLSVLVSATATAALALSACGGSSTPSPAASGGVTLVSDGKLSVCTHLSYKPFEYADDTGKVVGFDVDLINLTAKKLGATFELVDIEFAQITSGAVFAAKKCDIAMGAITINDKRKEAVGFSIPYFSATQALLVKSDSGFKTLADLKGKKVGVQSDTTGQDYAKKNEAANGYTTVVFDDLPTELTGLKAGRVDAAINDNGPILDFAKSNTDTAVATEFNTNESYGFVGQKNDANATKLMAIVDSELKASAADGTYAKIYKQYFGTEPKTLPGATS